MAQEIEHKFLVKGEFKHLSKKYYLIKQGYLSTDPKRTVRIRIKGNKAFITIKGKSNTKGLSRFEWEKEITIEEAEELLKLCKPTIINKIRYEIPFEGKLFEVDEFHGLHEGLIIAELEVKNVDEKFSIPDFIGLEVTGNKKYYNSYLSSNKV